MCGGESTIRVFSQKSVCVFICGGLICLRCRGVAQPGRVLAWGARGRKFESCHPDHKISNGCRSCFLKNFVKSVRKKDGI